MEESGLLGHADVVVAGRHLCIISYQGRLNFQKRAEIMTRQEPFQSSTVCGQQKWQIWVEREMGHFQALEFLSLVLFG